MGKGARKTYLRLDLARAPGTPGSCGVKYNKVHPEAYYAHEFFHTESLHEKVYLLHLQYFLLFSKLRRNEWQ